MSLTKEVLGKNEALTGLEENQINAIVELSVKDEDIVIGSKIGEIYGNIDTDITGVLGVQKPEGKKTYDWLKEDVLPMVKESKELKTKFDALNVEKVALEDKIAKGANVDPELKNQLEEKTKALETLTTQYDADKKLLQEKIEGMKTETFKSKIDFESKSAESKLNFSDGIPESSRSILINSVKGQLLSEFDTEFIDDGNGGERLVFKDKTTGAVKNNPDTLNPLSLEEMLKMKLKDNLKKEDGGQGGTGSGAGGQQKTDGVLVLNGVTTQVEASEKIQNHLMAKGMTRESKEFQPEFDKIWKENKVGELKLR